MTVLGANQRARCIFCHKNITLRVENSTISEVFLNSQSSDDCSNISHVMKIAMHNSTIGTLTLVSSHPNSTELNIDIARSRVRRLCVYDRCFAECYGVTEWKTNSLAQQVPTCNGKVMRITANAGKQCRDSKNRVLLNTPDEKTAGYYMCQ